MDDDALPPLPAQMAWEAPTPRNLAALRHGASTAAAGSDPGTATRRAAERTKRAPSHQHRDGDGDGDDDDDHSDTTSAASGDADKSGKPATGDDAAADNGAAAATIPKIRKSRPKLDAERLLGENGILKLHRTVQRATFAGKNHEQADLARLMRIFSHWAHELFPRYKLRDFAAATERLAASKRLRLHLHRWRMNPHSVTMLSDEMVAAADMADDDGPGAGAQISGPGQVATAVETD